MWMRSADVSATHVLFIAVLKQNFYFRYGIHMFSQYVITHSCSCLSSKTLGILLILTLKECISIYLNMCKFLLKIYLNLSNDLCSARLLCVCNIVYSTYSCLIQILRKTTVLTTRYMQSKSYSFKPSSVLGPSVLGIQVFCTMTHATIFFLQDRAHIRMMQYKSKCCYCAFLVI